MNASDPDWDAIRAVPEADGLNVRVCYWLGTALETSHGIEAFFQHPNPRWEGFKTQVDAQQDIWMHQIVVDRADFMLEDFDRYARAVPRTYAEDARPAATLNLEIANWPEAQGISVDLEEWIRALEQHAPEFGVAQERGELVQGVYRERDQLYIVGSANDGVRTRADLLEHQLKTARNVIESDLKKSFQGVTKIHG